MDHAIVGLDIGGTAVKGGLLGTNGDIVHKDTMQACHRSGHEAFIESICDFIDRLADGCVIKAVGIGIAGILDRERTMVVESPNLQQLQRLPLRQLLEQRLSRPVCIENDANAAALGELRKGAGRGLSNFLFFTLGTGIGSAIILNGRLWRGEEGKAGEFGHLTIESGGQRCGCGRKGCLEAYSSGTAIERMARSAAIHNEHCALHAHAAHLDAITPEIVYQYAQKGDKASKIIFETVARGLAQAIADVNNLLDIHTFIIGGGISRAADFFIPLIMEALAPRLFTVSRSRIRLLRAELGNDAGLLGAACMASDRLLQEQKNG